MRSSMKKLFFIFFLFSSLPAILAAQEAPKFEAFLGYSHFRMPSGFDLDELYPTTEEARLSGFDITITWNINRWLGADADFGHYDGKVNSMFVKTGRISSQDASITSYLFGPRVFYRVNRFTPFVHSLFGGMALGRGPYTGNGRSAAGIALGGGVDISVARHFSVRAIQADYVRSDFVPTGQNNLRLCIGGVLRF